MPLKILHLVAGPMAGGAEIHVKDLALALARRGEQPLIGFVEHARDAGRSDAFEARYVAELDAAGIDHVFIGHECRRNPLLGAWRVRRACRAHRIDVYHSHLKYGIAFGLLLGIPRVHTHHSSAPRMSRLMYRLMSPLVDAFVGISDACARMLADFAGREVTTIRNGIDLQRVAAPGAIARKLRQPLECIALGRLHPAKDYPTLIEAVRLLSPATRANIHVSLVGEGPPDLTAELRAAISAANLGQTITLLGNRGDVAQLLGQSQLCLMSSAWEGFPIALLEATAAGLPFIATDVGGCAEIAAVGGNGIVVPARDPAALAAQIEALLNDPERFSRLSRNALDNAHLFDIAETADQHIRLYENLLSNARVRPARQPRTAA